MTVKSATKKRASRSVATKTPKEKTPKEAKTKTKTTADTTTAKSTTKKRTKPRGSDVEKAKKDQPRPSSKKNETDDGGGDRETTPLLRAVGDRLRFLFSDANLRADRRLRAKMRESGDGSVAVSDLLRLRTIKSLTERAEDVTEAARKHCASLVEVVPNKNALRRTDDFDPAAPPDLERSRARSVVLSGLPATNDGNRYDVTIKEIVDLFDPPPALVKLRYDKKGKASAKGNAFVEFHDEKSAKKVFKKHGDGVTKLRLKDKELTVVAMSTWHEERAEKKRPRDDDDEDDVRERGRVVSLKGLPDGCDRETILAFVETLDFRAKDDDDDGDGSPSTVYVDYSRGQKDGSVHFPPKTTCDKKLARIVKSLQKGKRTIGDAKHKLADAALLAGEKEKAYWKAFAESKRARAKRRRS